MFLATKERRFNLPSRAIALVVLTAFLTTSIIPPQKSYAQSLNLPEPGSMIRITSQFQPAIIKGIKMDPHNPLLFNFLIDPGQVVLNNDEQKVEYRKLIKYFLTALTTPEHDMWVNLSPYEHRRMVSDNLGQTEMGRDMLAQDYVLKQLTASLVYPEESLGKKFWNEVYERIRMETGSIANVPVNTFNKVWIIPDKATVFEKGNVAMVVNSHMKVMLDQDYLSLDKHANYEKMGLNSINDGNFKSISRTSSDVVREIIVPAIEKEVNEGRNFAKIRQIYSSMILASWFKQRLKMHLLSKVYVNKNENAGFKLQDPKDKERIYQNYLKAFKKGVFNYIKEDTDAVTGETVPRKYFSGGASYAMLATSMESPNAVMHATSDTDELNGMINSPLVVVPTQLSPTNGKTIFTLKKMSAVAMIWIASSGNILGADNNANNAADNTQKEIARLKVEIANIESGHQATLNLKENQDKLRVDEARLKVLQGSAITVAQPKPATMPKRGVIHAVLTPFRAVVKGTGAIVSKITPAKKVRPTATVAAPLVTENPISPDAIKLFSTVKLADGNKFPDVISASADTNGAVKLNIYKDHIVSAVWISQTDWESAKVSSASFFKKFGKMFNWTTIVANPKVFTNQKIVMFDGKDKEVVRGTFVGMAERPSVTIGSGIMLDAPSDGKAAGFRHMGEKYRIMIVTPDETIPAGPTVLAVGDQYKDFVEILNSVPHGQFPAPDQLDALEAFAHSPSGSDTLKNLVQDLRVAKIDSNSKIKRFLKLLDGDELSLKEIMTRLMDATKVITAAPATTSSTRPTLTAPQPSTVTTNFMTLSSGEVIGVGDVLAYSSANDAERLEIGKVEKYRSYLGPDDRVHSVEITFSRDKKVFTLTFSAADIDSLHKQPQQVASALAAPAKTSWLKDLRSSTLRKLQVVERGFEWTGTNAWKGVRFGFYDGPRSVFYDNNTNSLTPTTIALSNGDVINVGDNLIFAGGLELNKVAKFRLFVGPKDVQNSLAITYTTANGKKDTITFTAAELNDLHKKAPEETVAASTLPVETKKGPGWVKRNIIQPLVNTYKKAETVVFSNSTTKSTSGVTVKQEAPVKSIDAIGDMSDFLNNNASNTITMWLLKDVKDGKGEKPLTNVRVLGQKVNPDTGIMTYTIQGIDSKRKLSKKIEVNAWDLFRVEVEDLNGKVTPYQFPVPKTSTQKEKEVGGIDFDAKYLQLNMQGDGMNVSVPKGFEWLLKMNIRGFIPRILDIRAGTGLELSFFQGVLTPQQERSAKADLPKPMAVDYKFAMKEWAAEEHAEVV